MFSHKFTLDFWLSIRVHRSSKLQMVNEIDMKVNLGGHRGHVQEHQICNGKICEPGLFFRKEKRRGLAEDQWFDIQWHICDTLRCNVACTTTMVTVVVMSWIAPPVASVIIPCFSSITLTRALLPLLSRAWTSLPKFWSCQCNISDFRFDVGFRINEWVWSA